MVVSLCLSVLHFSPSFLAPPSTCITVPLMRSLHFVPPHPPPLGQLMGSRLHWAGRHHRPSRARPEALAARECPATERVVPNLRHVAWRPRLREPHCQACSLSVSLFKRRRAFVVAEAGRALLLGWERCFAARLRQARKGDAGPSLTLNASCPNHTLTPPFSQCTEITTAFGIRLSTCNFSPP